MDQQADGTSKVAANAQEDGRAKINRPVILPSAYHLREVQASKAQLGHTGSSSKSHSTKVLFWPNVVQSTAAFCTRYRRIRAACLDEVATSYHAPTTSMHMTGASLAAMCAKSCWLSTLGAHPHQPCTHTSEAHLKSLPTKIPQKGRELEEF